MSPYPEHEKLAAIKERRDTINEFIEWLTDHETLGLIQWTSYTDSKTNRRVHEALPLSDGEKARAIAEFLGIDYDAFQAEKKRMLEEYREACHG